MKLDNGVQDRTSHMGGILTVLVMIVTLGYTYTKLVNLKDKSNADITSYMTENAIAYDEKFTGKDDGFFMAAAITAYDSETESIEDPSYGELIIRQ